MGARLLAAAPVTAAVVRPDELGQEDVDRWSRLQVENAALDSPFLGPEFALAVGRVRERTRIAVLAEGDEVAGYWPFERHGGGRAVALGMGLTDVQGMVLRPGADLDLGRALLAAGLRSFRADHLLADQSTGRSAPARWLPEHSPALDLSAGFDGYVASRRERSRSLLQSTARKRRKLEREHGEVRLTVHTADHAALDRALSWKSDQYRRTGRRDRFANPATLRLVHDLLDLVTPNFSAPLSLLMAGNRLVAAHLGVRSRTNLAWWFPVYDPQFAAYSPGLILCLDLARAVAEDGVTLLDLGKGDEPYKERLANTSVSLAAGTVAANDRVLGLQTAAAWPAQRARRLVLESPRLRGTAREALAAVGRVRQLVR